MNVFRVLSLIRKERERTRALAGVLNMTPELIRKLVPDVAQTVKRSLVDGSSKHGFNNPINIKPMSS